MMRLWEVKEKGTLDERGSLQVPTVSVVQSALVTGGNEFRDRILFVVNSTEPVLERS